MKQIFDNAASSYDRDFTESKTARWLRAQVHARLDKHFAPGSTVLELGCGTGEDALHLAQRGVSVTATDASPAMLEVARAKLAGQNSATVARLDLRQLPQADLPGRFDGVFSNFGVLNCLDNWQPLAAWLAARLKPGSIVGLGVMSPVCLWEIGWHGLHGNFKTALRRLRRDSRFQLADGEAITISYPGWRKLKSDFMPWFDFVGVRGLGVFLPPSDIYPVIEKRPRLHQTLTSLEEKLANYWPLVGWGDHYWLELRKI